MSLRMPGSRRWQLLLLVARRLVAFLILILLFAALGIGCSGGEAPTGIAETVSAKRFGRRDGEQAFFWETDSAPTPGRSGGPLVVGGRVVGLCVAGKDGKGYYAHADELLAGLKADGFGWLWEAK